MNINPIVTKLMAQKGTLVNNRKNLDSTFENISLYVRPERQGIITKKTEGEQRTDKLYDPTAIHASTRLAAVMRSMLTDVNTRFAYLVTGDEELDKLFDVKAWLDDTSERMRQAFYDSNFSVVSDEFYLDLGSFCTACIYLEEGKDSVLNFRTISVADFVFTEDDQGLPDAIWVNYCYSATQAAQRFGIDKLHKDIVDALDSNPTKTFDFTHVVMRRDNVKLRKFGKLNMPWASYWICNQHSQLVEESGYMENPYAVARWRKASSTAWGYGPGHNSLPDIMELNDKARTAKILRNKISEPAYWAESGSIDGPLRLDRNRVNWGKKGSQPPIELTNVNPTGLQFLLGEITELKDAIYDAFFVNQLSLIDRRQMTAAEVYQRTEENMRVMGPTYERLVFEFLNKVVNRAFGIMMRAGLFKQPPDVLAGRELNIKYESPLARAQKGQMIEAMNDVLVFGANLAQIKGPQVLDRIDEDKMFAAYLDQRGIPADIQNSDDMMEQSRMARQQAQQQQEAMMAMQAGAETAATMNQAQSSQGVPA